MRVYPIFLMATTAALAGCSLSARADNGPQANRSFTVSDFTGLEVAGPYNVTVRTGSAASVQATGTDKALDAMRVEVRDGTLEISPAEHHFLGFRWGNWGHAGSVNLTVTVPALERAAIAGSGAIDVDKVSGPRFKGEIAGSGDLHLAAVDAGEVSLEIAGSGGIRAAGKAKSVKYEIAGSGDIDAAGLAAETAAVSIAGSGGIKGHASGTAKVEIMGSGDVDMTGGARCSVSKSGSGDIRCS